MSTFAKNQGLPGLPSLPGLPASKHLLKMKFSTRNQGLPGLPSLPGLPGLPKCKKSPFGLTTSLIWYLETTLQIFSQSCSIIA